MLLTISGSLFSPRGYLGKDLCASFEELDIILVGLESSAKAFCSEIRAIDRTRDSHTRQQVVLSINPYPGILVAARALYPRAKQICLLVEPSVTWPWSKRNKLLERYDLVLSSSAMPLQNWRYSPWPILDPSEIEYSSYGQWTYRSDVPCIIASNKLSLVGGELYTLRREVIHSGMNLALAGHDWETSFSLRAWKLLGEAAINFKSMNPIHIKSIRRFFRRLPETVKYEGGVESKTAFARNHKYAIVIENSMELITEKIYDALFAGCIPIYVGPIDVSSEIPENLFVKSKPSVSSVFEALEMAKSYDHQKWLERRNHLVGNLSQNHGIESFLRHLRELVLKS